MRPGLRWLNNDRARLALLTAVLVLLAAYAVTAGTGPFGVGNGSATDQAGTGCPADATPALVNVSLTRLLALRARLDRTMAGFEPGLRPYEEGLVPTTSAWTDAEPVAGARPPSGTWPAGYEMRWWLESGDDLVADVFVFAAPKQARDFGANPAAAMRIIDESGVCRTYARGCPQPAVAQPAWSCAGGCLSPTR
jgi:hypothetical protein